MIEIQLDGRQVNVESGLTVIQAADAAGIYVPHFCYHKKLSIAANCRMCLVDIEKMPKPMPACATPATNGMVVHTRSDKAVRAQQSVMEFLLINHPLDCPICDQGGECQLQDLAVGYGAGASRYTEEKRVVFHKDVGPLLGMEEMSRCIHCTRCIRFGQEVAGVMELGMIHRGEHSEITTADGRTVDSELSGNMIDICPVGAITSKPFRYSARTWELSRRTSISPHDSTGANLIVQVKSGRVMRVVPLENEAVNECWIADRDRFSYEALNSESRLTEPQIKQGGVWQPVDWTTALAYVANGLKRVQAEFGKASVGAIGHVSSTLEELHLLAKLVRGLGSESIDHRTRQADFTHAAPSGHARWLGMPIAALAQLDRVFVIGSFLRKDHPLLAQRLRQAARRGAQVHGLHALRDDWLMLMATELVAPPSGWVQSLADVAAAVAQGRGVKAPVQRGDRDGVETGADQIGAAEGQAEARAIAESLLTGERKAVLLGNTAMQHPEAAQLLALADFIAEHTGAVCGVLGDGANAVGAQLVNALPGEGGLNAGQMQSQPMKALLLLHTEPVLDSADAAAARAALASSGLVVAMTPFKDAASEFADVMLPIAPFTETAGAFVNTEGRLQSFHGVVKPLGDTRPGWKVLRVLGNLLGLPGFDYNSAEEVRADALGPAFEQVAAEASRQAVTHGPRPTDTRAVAQADTQAAAPPAALAARLDNRGGVARIESKLRAVPAVPDLQRISDVPIYATDSLVRRSPPLQLTADAREPVVGVPAGLWQQLQLKAGDSVRVRQGSAAAVLPALLDPTLAQGTLRIAAGHPRTAMLGAMFGAVVIEAVATDAHP